MQLTIVKTSNYFMQACRKDTALKPVIGIHLLDFDLFENPGETHQAHWRFEMRDRQNPQTKLGDELQLHIIELPKADRLGVTSGHLAHWVALFEHWQEESTMQTIDYTPRAVGS